MQSGFMEEESMAQGRLQFMENYNIPFDEQITLLETFIVKYNFTCIFCMMGIVWG